MRKIKADDVYDFEKHLISEEKATATVEKYLRDIQAFVAWLGGRSCCKNEVLAYKAVLCEKYKTASVNSMLSSLNAFFAYREWYECKVKAVKVQRRIFAQSDKELSKGEYERLLKAAKSKGNERLWLLMQTICSCGILECPRCALSRSKRLQGKARIFIARASKGRFFCRASFAKC